MFIGPPPKAGLDLVIHSRSFVRSSVRPSVRTLFFSLVSMESLEHLECHKASKSIKEIKFESTGVKRVSQDFKGVYLQIPQI